MKHFFQSKINWIALLMFGFSLYSAFGTPQNSTVLVSPESVVERTIDTLNVLGIPSETLSFKDSAHQNAAPAADAPPNPLSEITPIVIDTYKKMTSHDEPPPTKHKYLVFAVFSILIILFRTYSTALPIKGIFAPLIVFGLLVFLPVESNARNRYSDHIPIRCLAKTYATLPKPTQLTIHTNTAQPPLPNY
jgi:hypothetical protein